MVQQAIGMAETTRTPASRSRWLVLAMLLMLNVLLTLDKTIFLILLEPIKKEFALSDLALGALSGTAFALCMGLAGLPLGALVDRGNRRNIASACLGVWSAMTMICGAAMNYWQLLLARMMVGVGEAGGAPAALSIIADIFERGRRATAMSIFALGPPLATVISLSVGTLIVHEYGWRTTLVVAGMPGVVLALLMLAVIREPARAEERNAHESGASGYGETFRMMVSVPSFFHLVAGVFVSYLVLAGASTFNNSFLVRVHNVELHKIGPYLGVLMSVIGVIASTSVGIVTDAMGRRDERWRGWIMAIGSLFSVLFGLAYLTIPVLWLTLVLVALFAASATYWLGPAYSLCQSLAPTHMRGRSLAIMLLIGNTGGYIIAPAAVGFVSDQLGPRFGHEGLRYALLGLTSLGLWSATHFWMMARHLPKDLGRLSADGRLIPVGDVQHG